MFLWVRDIVVAILPDQLVFDEIGHFDTVCSAIIAANDFRSKVLLIAISYTFYNG